MEMRAKVWLLGCVLGVMVSFLVSPQCFGAGFALWEGSARGDALGQAVVGRADDPSAVFYNPAGITQLPGFQVMAGGTAILLHTEVKSPVFGSQDNNDNWGFPPHFYATYQYSSRLYFGLGVYSPFGLATEFPRNWAGAFNSYDAEVQSININPNVALKLTDQLSIAAGFDAMWFGFNLKQLINPLAQFNLPFPTALAPSVKLEGGTWGYGFNLAAHYKPCEFFSMGLSYRSQVKQAGGLDADFVAPSSPVFPTGLQSHSTAQTSVTLPDSVAMGLTFYPTKYLSWEIGGVWTHWSEFNTLSFSNLPFPLPSTSNSPKNWRDTWRFQTGVEYKAYPWLDLRAGYIFDQEAIRNEFADYLLPSNNRNYFSVGPGFHWCNWTVDLSYTYVMVEDRDVLNSQSLGYLNPTYLRDGHANLIGASVSYKF
jgi:long-chain fatty acid transport protein